MALSYKLIVQIFLMIEILQKSHKNANAQLELAQKSLLMLMQRKDLGFLELPFRMNLWGCSIDLAKKWRPKYRKLGLIGIGGSSICVRSLREIFRRHDEVIIFDNIDPEDFKYNLSKIGDPREIGWAIVSKSGTTIETLTALEYVLDFYEQQKVYFYDQAVAITEAGENSLNQWAKENKVPVLDIPKDVGGRFSVLSPVGIFPAAFMGINVENLRQGSMLALKETALVTQFIGQVLQSYERQEWISLFWFYNSRMRWFGTWLQQLWAESLGKRLSKKGDEAPRVSTPMWAIGASDQHSILQQVMEGHRDKFNIFFQADEGESNLPFIHTSHFRETRFLANHRMDDLIKIEAKSTQEALSSNQVSTVFLRSKSLNELQLGFLFMFFQLVVGGLGEALNINAFDQPGVELGKRLTLDKLTGQESST